ncbi:MAG: hypothetical protein CM15mP49_21250 [Actinomycetota bacterium]|nr:MAG: hypothetical protein CM15mP49_21250 [Actinomycetota bacterium]
MQGLADGYFVLPYTIGNYLAPLLGESTLDESDPACATVVNDVAERTQKWLSVNGTRSVDWFHRELGKLVWNFIGMERDKNGLERLYQKFLHYEKSSRKTSGFLEQPIISIPHLKRLVGSLTSLS